jgi:flagellum-specific peptidoglycan hydrolase FlgJ
LRKTIVFLAMAVLSLNIAALAEARQKPAEGAGAKLAIAGPPLASEKQAVNFIKKSSPGAKLNCTVEEIVRLYYKEAGEEGIRPDVALSQALLETGFFRYGGDVKPKQNNFCGLGSVGGGAQGASFATPEIGVRAHIQHLLAYSSKRAPKTAIVDPRYKIVKSLPNIFGACATWQDLNGRWARAGIPYGERIIDIHQRMLQTEPRGKPPAKVEEDAKKEPEPKEPEQKEEKPPQKKKKSRKKQENDGTEADKRQAIGKRIQEILKEAAKR